MLFIEYDVGENGLIEIVALVNAVEENGEDPAGEAWMRWRESSFDDNGVGCVGVSSEDLALMEATEHPEQLQAIVERIILTDRATKEEVPS
jgi:hypothetical protein